GISTELTKLVVYRQRGKKTSNNQPGKASRPAHVKSVCGSIDRRVSAGKTRFSGHYREPPALRPGRRRAPRLATDYSPSGSMCITSSVHPLPAALATRDDGPPTEWAHHTRLTLPRTRPSIRSMGRFWC